MKLTHDELEFLCASAREAWEPACYELPAHRVQLAHGVAGAKLILFIKAWTESEARRIKRFSPPPSTRNPAGRGPRPGTSPVVWQKRASGEHIGKEGKGRRTAK
jgi:hypothetical protein